MNVNTDEILFADELSDLEQIKRRLSEQEKLVVLERNVPQFVILSVERYEALARLSVGSGADSGGGPENSIKISRLVKETFQAYSLHNSLPPAEIERLCDRQYCKETFGLSSFSVLLPYNPAISYNNQGRDSNNIRRYYRDAFYFNGAQYFLCSQFLEKHKRRFMDWTRRWTR